MPCCNPYTATAQRDEILRFGQSLYSGTWRMLLLQMLFLRVSPRAGWMYSYSLVSFRISLEHSGMMVCDLSKEEAWKC